MFVILYLNKKSHYNPIRCNEKSIEENVFAITFTVMRYCGLKNEL